MEARKRKRVLLRLAAATGGVALSLVFVAVSIGSWWESDPPASPSVEPLLAKEAIRVDEEAAPKALSNPYYIPAEEVVSGPLLSTPLEPQAEWQVVPLQISTPSVQVPAEKAEEDCLATPVVETVVESVIAPKHPELTDDDLRGYTASLNEINRRLQPEVQEGFALGKAGAIYAARGQFIGVLRKIALAKDAELGTTRYTTALADGLRALDEADDFVPRGDTLEAELDTLAIADSHCTPVVREAGFDAVTSHEAIALYSRYAAEKIGEAVAGEQAGSMACYGLGKAYARLEVQADDAAAGRKSAVLHRAALVAHEGNYMAANELGVWLARVGRYEQAGRVLRQATAHGAPISTIYENLAKVEQKLGQQQMALAAQEQSKQIAQAEIANGALSQRRGIEWVDPGAFRQPGAAPIASAPTPVPQSVASNPYPQLNVPQPPPVSGWQKFKQATGWSQPQGQPTAPAVGWQPYPNAPRQASRQATIVR